ncbi:MAG: ABC transporter substrate-binding protein [Betaproteobacteria bacterium]|nr:ABC transporter substrate-binding protein [Betaproteobacteria bacterium]
MNTRGPHLHAFSSGLRGLGYVEGRNIVVELRSADGNTERLPELAAALASLRVDVLVAPDPPSTFAAKAATKTIPIVMRSSNDPVEMGLVSSLARPGGNVTGVYSLYAELTPKRLELLKEAIPGLTRVAVLWNPEFRGSQVVWRDTQAAAKALGLTLHSLEVRRPEDLEGAFRAASAARDGALLTLRNPLLVVHRRRIAVLAAQSRVPVMYDEREFVDEGGLMSYGANLDDLYRRAAAYVDKILKGASPAEIAVEQPTRFELVINMKTARTLGITIARSVLLRADRVVE